MATKQQAPCLRVGPSKTSTYPQFRLHGAPHGSHMIHSMAIQRGASDEPAAPPGDAAGEAALADQRPVRSNQAG